MASVTPGRKPRVTKNSRDGALPLSSKSTPFPTHSSDETLIEWLSAPGNRDFSQFREAKASDVASWGLLIDQLQEVTEQGKDWEELWYDVFEDIFDDFRGTQRVPTNLQLEASIAVANNILNHMEAKIPKEHYAEWLQAVCAALLPRVIHRWKKQLKKKPHTEDRELDGTPVSPRTPPSKPSAKLPSQPILTPKPPPKRQKVALNLPGSSSASQNIAFTTERLASTTPSLMDCSLIVRWKGSVDNIYTEDDTEDGEEMVLMCIAIAALVTPAAHAQSSEDIREDHIDYEMVLTILTEVERDIGKAIQDRRANLTWQYTEEDKDRDSPEVTVICDGSDFRRAVAYMMWQKRRVGAEPEAFIEFDVVENREEGE